MRHSKLHTAANFVWAARSDGGDALPLLQAYAGLKAREFVDGRRGDSAVKRVRILDLDVVFFDYYWLVEMFEEIFLRRQYHFEAAKDNPLVVDVGSNIGLSILYFKRRYPRATVIGFEPDTVTFDVLATNVKRNRLANVELVNEAVFDGRDVMTLHRHSATPGSPQASTRAERGGDTRLEVRASRLSERVTGPVDFMKIDVEGAEHVVLRELADAGKLELVRELALEYHHQPHGEAGSLSELLGLLEEGGFAYELEARLPGAGAPAKSARQNILVRAYLATRNGAAIVGRSE